MNNAVMYYKSCMSVVYLTGICRPTPGAIWLHSQAEGTRTIIVLLQPEYQTGSTGLQWQVINGQIQYAANAPESVR